MPGWILSARPRPWCILEVCLELPRCRKNGQDKILPQANVLCFLLQLVCFSVSFNIHATGRATFDGETQRVLYHVLFLLHVLFCVASDYPCLLMLFGLMLLCGNFSMFFAFWTNWCITRTLITPMVVVQ